MSRLITILGCCALLATPSALASPIRNDNGGSAKRSQTTVSWAQPEIRYVVQHGLMAKTVAAFRADDTLTQGELAAVVAGLTKHSAGTVAAPGATVTVTQLDARLVRALDLSDAAAASAPAPRRPALRRPHASAPRPSRGCSGCARTIPPPTTTSSFFPPTRSPGPRPPTP